MFLTMISFVAIDRLCLILVIFFNSHGIALSGSSRHNQQEEFLQDLNDYTIVIPSRVSREGEHLSYTLHPEHSLRRRSADFLSHHEDDTLHYKVQIEKKIHILQLNPNYKLISPGFVIERKKNVFKNVSDSTFTRLHEDHKNCHYHGKVVNQSETKVAVGVCNGLHGFIHSEDGDYFIEPIKDQPSSRDGQHRHVVYRRSALPPLMDPLSSVHVHQRSTAHDDSCGVKGTANEITKRERWELHHRRKRKSSSFSSSHRSKRSFSTERYVETLVVVDPSMLKYHKNEHLETYVLTIMNMVAAMFHDASIGNSINVVLVRILLMEEHQEELVITHHADHTLNSFCKFQKTINFKDDDHPNHHDVAILLTRHNICSNLNEPCGTLGLAQVSGMCQPHRSCSINEDTGLALAYTVTHELGHNFGMHHDGVTNGCDDPPGKQLYVMSPSLVADSLSKTWSNCSKAYITKFIDRDWGYCLDDEPIGHEYKFPVLPPGTMYDADHQCRLQYGKDDATICTNEQDVCSNLWCRSDNRCSTHLEAAAEGTICGTNKWCYQGECVKIGDRPECINGEWGEWTPWSDCTRTCGAGISHSQRHCDNPAPSDGGKYCLGERKRYRICNTEDCPDNGVTFNEKQCEEFNYIPYKKGLYKWEHVQSSESPCQLHCKPKGHFFSVLLKDIVTDGTGCTAGTRNMCISGRCRHVGCDYAIDSTAKEDRCGICHGDGTTCTTIKSQFNESLGLGYVEAGVIPTGARNIRVEEVAAANNFLALQNDKGEYHLNGHWFIQWSGEYKVAGTVVQYTREENKESFAAAGPLKEPLHIMLLLQSENPGVVFEYTVPKDNISEPRVPEFHWHYQDWAHCTASCGGGSQRSEVVCTEIEAGIVDDKYCNISTKPDDMQKVCNEHLCPAKWWMGPWQHCSVTCGDNGMHQRTVICVRSLGADEQIALDDEACLDEKPAELEACHKKEACPSHSAWITGEWSSCNGNPCGLKYRTVTCENTENGCEGNKIPVSEMQCSEIVCGHWVTNDWTECTRSCGDGVQLRKVTCVGDSHVCDTRTIPPSQQNCTLGPCPTDTLHKPTTTNNREPVHSTTAPIENINITPSPKVINSTEENIVKVEDSTTESTLKGDIEAAKSSPKPDIKTSKMIENNEYKSLSSENIDDNANNDEKINENTNDVKTNNEEKEEYIEIENVDTTEDKGVEHIGGTEQKSEAITPGKASEYNLDITDIEPDTETSTQESIFINNEGSDITSVTDGGNQREPSNKQNNEMVHEASELLGENKDITDIKAEAADKMLVDSGEVNETEGAGKSDETELDKKDHKHENQATRHKHRQHHGENLGVGGNIDVQEREHIETQEEDQSNAVGEDLEEDKWLENYKDNDFSIEEEKFDETEDNEGTAQDNIVESYNPNSLVDGNENEETSPPVDSPRQEYPQLDKLPALPDKDKLSPLPSSSDHKLPALPDKDSLSSLPKLGNLPPLPSNGEMPTMPNIKHLAPLPKFEDLPPLPKSIDLTDKLPALLKLDEVPSLHNYNNLPPLPKKDGLAALPDIGDLPPMPRMKDLPKKHFLPPPLSSMQKPTNSETEMTAADDKHETETIDIPLGINKPQEIKQPVDTTDNSMDNNQYLPPSKEHAGNGMASPNPGPVFNPSTKPEIINSSSDTVVDDKETPTPSPNVIASVHKSDSPDDIKEDGDAVLLHGLVPGPMKSSVESEQNVDVEPVKKALFKWMSLEWTECSRVCSGGIRSRSVVCVGVDSSSRVDQHHCDSNDKPVYSENCNTQLCLEWTVLDWSSCSATCGVSIRSRRVFCPQKLSCDPVKQPIEKETCDMPACAMWVSGQWSRCSKKCDGGEQVRLVQCVNLTSQLASRGCDYNTKPGERQDCNKEPCQNHNAALTINCEHNEMSSIVCRALRKMGQCHRRFVSLKCCKTCSKNSIKKLNKDRPKSQALR